MLLSQSVQPVMFSEEEVGKAIMNATDYQQRLILIAMADAAENMTSDGGSWLVQCRAIVNGVSGKESGLAENDRVRIAAMLQCLIDHLTELPQAIFLTDLMSNTETQ